MDVFSKQIDLASKLNIPVSVHCVKAFGAMLDIFNSRKQLPRCIVFHSFGGSKEMVTAFLKLKTKVMFGFSAVINMRSPKTPEVIASVPIDNILLESDYPTLRNIDHQMKNIAKIVANAKKISVEKVVQETRENATSVIDGTSKEKEKN